MFTSIRNQMVGKVQARLRKVGHPRAQMALMVSATGFAAFLASFLLLHLGVERMALRYPLALVCSYLVFLVLIRLWLAFQRRRRAREDSGGGSSWSFGSSGSSGSSGSGGSMGSSEGPSFRGGGGMSGGGGASGSFDEGTPAVMPVTSSSGGGMSGGSGGGASGGTGDLDELLAVLALLAALAAALGAAIYLIVQGPAILAEILLDGALSASLYRHLSSIEEHHTWLETAIRRTAIPFAIVAVLFSVAGYAAQAYAPEATSIGGVWRHLLG